MRKTTKILITLIVIFSIFLILTTCYAASDFRLKAMDFDAKLNTDGSMNVIETWNIRIDGETNTLFKEYELQKGNYKIKDVKVKDLTASKEFNKVNMLMYHVTTDSYYAMNNKEGNFEIAWGVNKESGQRQYQISYTVENAVTIYNDVAEVYWQFLGKKFGNNVDFVTGKITLPAGVTDMENLRAWAHGPLNGEIERTDSKTVSFNVKPYYKGYGLEVRLGILEPNMFMLSTNTKPQNKLQSILNEEQSWADKANKDRESVKARDNAIKYGILVVSIAIGIFFIFRSIKNTKILKETTKLVPSQDLEYYRDIPNEKEATPTEAAFLYYYDKSKMRSHLPKILSAIMLDLALKKYIEFEIKTNNKGKEEIHVKIVPDKTESDLKESEAICYRLFKVIAARDTMSFTMKDFEKYAKTHDTTFLSKLNSIETATEKEQVAIGNYNKEMETKKNSWRGKGALALVLMMFYAVFAVAIFEGTYLEITAISLAISLIPALIYSIICFNISSKFSGLTQVGLDEKEQWQGLKKYMNDFSLLNEKEVPELVLWEKYLVYATVFGIAEKVISQLKVKYPEFASDEYMRNTAYFYVMTHSNFNTTFINSINTSVSRAYQSSIASSSSSSGGGYGGGFSGGGGRRRRRRPEAVEDKTSLYLRKNE